MLKLAIPKEPGENENRVALVPNLVKNYQQLGIEVWLEQDAGSRAFFTDSMYENVKICGNTRELYSDADIILKVNTPTSADIELMKDHALLIGLLNPAKNPENIQAMRIRPLTSFALELLPRISRAQGMDVLSSQATVVGYKAVLLAANLSQRFFPMLTTAAGTIRPTSVLVIGAGVAGLQAIATARRLGAMVSAYDIRPAAREQVESLGAKMIQIEVSAESAGGYARQLSPQEQQKQTAALAEAVAKAEVIICTAMIPGKTAPKIINSAMVEQMQPGAVIIDIAASSGGNCELTVLDQTIEHQGILIAGPSNLASMMAHDASIMYAKNIYNFVQLFVKEGKVQIDWQDQILAESVLTHDGTIKHQPTKEIIEGSNA